jgi:hypothetical protein
LAVLRDKQGHLWFAGDRRASWGFHKAIRTPRPKISKRNGILLAGTGVSLICDLVVDLFDIPKYSNKLSTFEYMHKVFIPELLVYLRAERWIKDDARELKYNKATEDQLEGYILVGVHSDLYELILSTELIGVDAVDAPYALGCGGQLALGSLLTTERVRMSTSNRLKLALEVAFEVSPGCGDGIDILNNKGNF